MGFAQRQMATAMAMVMLAGACSDPVATFFPGGAQPGQATQATSCMSGPFAEAGRPARRLAEINPASLAACEQAATRPNATPADLRNLARARFAALKFGSGATQADVDRTADVVELAASRGEPWSIMVAGLVRADAGKLDQTEAIAHARAALAKVQGATDQSGMFAQVALRGAIFSMAYGQMAFAPAGSPEETTARAIMETERPHVAFRSALLAYAERFGWLTLYEGQQELDAMGHCIALSNACSDIELAIVDNGNAQALLVMAADKLAEAGRYYETSRSIDDREERMRWRARSAGSISQMERAIRVAQKAATPEQAQTARKLVAMKDDFHRQIRQDNDDAAFQEALPWLILGGLVLDAMLTPSLPGDQARAREWADAEKRRVCSNARLRAMTDSSLDTASWYNLAYNSDCIGY